VIDADALKVISLKNVQNAILTPHMGEFKTMYESTTGEKLPDEDDARLAVRGMTMLKKYGNNSVILLKGPTDYVITKQELIENPRGNPRMRVAGTGDVLAGAIAGILAQTKQMMLSISVALPAVTITADLLYNQKGGSYTASDMLATLHKAIFK
jgi:NAD(P)H-hydrate epimerase